ncbi:hypothetical protein L4C31_14580, partial [Aliivibrio sifiae]
LYYYRCELVHSFQDPSDSDYGFISEPSYITSNQLVGFDSEKDDALIVETSAGLVYPTVFISKLLHSIVKNYHNECKSNNINTFEVKSLNKVWRLK